MKANFKAIIEAKAANIWYKHVIVPAPIVKKFIAADAKRVICSINGQIEFPCAILPFGDKGHFISINKENCKRAGVDVGSEIEVVIIKDESKYGMPVPEEMEILLAQDEEAQIYFDQLTPGKQRSLLYLIGKPKTSDTRIKKAIVITNHLKNYGGKIDFKQLQQDFKNYQK